MYGNLYLTNKLGWSEFTSDDEALVGALALAAGIAIENARLHQRVQSMAVLDERERLARDLHDTVIQQLFAAGLSLQSIAGRVSPPVEVERLNGVIADIDGTIRQIRSTIFELGLASSPRGLRASVVDLAKELRAVLEFDVDVSFDGPVDTTVTDEIAEHLLATLREALTNIGRHAEASRARVTLSVDSEMCSLQVLDDGLGIENGQGRGGGNGLGNMRRRAEKLDGSFEIGTPGSGGTLLIWQVPVRF